MICSNCASRYYTHTGYPICTMLLKPQPDGFCPHFYSVDKLQPTKKI